MATKTAAPAQTTRTFTVDCFNWNGKTRTLDAFSLDLCLAPGFWPDIVIVENPRKGTAVKFTLSQKNCYKGQVSSVDYKTTDVLNVTLKIFNE
jgi:hypothetical protein